MTNLAADAVMAYGGEFVMRICFYAAVSDPRLFETVGFYSQDIDLLQELGHEVVPLNRPSQLPGRHFDLYWAWWQTSGAPAVLYGKLASRPVVLLTALSDSDPTASGMASRSSSVKALARLSLRCADLVLATSQNCLAGLDGYKMRSAKVAYLGVDVGLFKPAPKAEPPFILTISHLTPDNVERKRILDLMEVAAIIGRQRPDVRFRIVGALGPSETLVREHARRVGAEANVDFLGWVSSQAKRELLASATVYLQPTHYEAFGLAIAEAMASGTAVVTNNVGSVPEVVGHDAALLGPDASAEEIASAVQVLLDDPSAADRLGRVGRSRAENSLSFARRRSLVEEALSLVAVGHGG